MSRKGRYLEKYKQASIWNKVKIVKALARYNILNSAYRNIGTNLDSMAKILEQEHPGNWDILLCEERLGVRNLHSFPKHFERGCSNIAPRIVIRYPKIAIFNSTGASHSIQDLFVEIGLVNAGQCIETTLRGLRMAASPDEIRANYQHSHLSTRSYKVTQSNDDAFALRGFCLGSSEINQVLTMLSMNYTEEIFKLLVFQLGEYVNWESIEGSPYAYFRNVIGSGTARNLGIDEILRLHSQIEEFRRENPMDIDFKLSSDGIKVVDNEKLEDYLRIWDDQYLYSSTNVLCQKDVKGNYYGLSLGLNFTSQLSDMETLEEISFTFRKEIVKFRVVEQEEQENKKFYIHKKVKNYVKSAIQEKINSKRLRGHITKQLNSIEHLKRDKAEDRLFMPKD